MERLVELEIAIGIHRPEAGPDERRGEAMLSTVVSATTRDSPLLAARASRATTASAA
jgi:hypothetical protein